MSRTRLGNLVELKYCEGCGCLLTREVGSGLTFCALCEAKQAKDTFLTPPPRRSPRSARLPNRGASDEFDLQACAEPGDDPDLKDCA